MSTSFADWVSTADAVRATPKKLEKHAALARYLGALDDSDLQIAARLFAGAPFPRRDERVLSMGWSALSGLLLERSGKTGGDMAESYQRHADLGDVAADLIAERSASGDRLTLADVAQTFDAIAAARGVAPKRDLLRATLARATPEEARYLVKIVSGETRIGLREGLLEEAIARAFDRDREVLAFAEGKAVPFTDFQTRLGRKIVADELRTKFPSTLVAFDILERDGRALLDAPFDERQNILRAVPIVPPVIFAQHQRIDASGDALIAILEREVAAARDRGDEGLVV